MTTRAAGGGATWNVRQVGERSIVLNVFQALGSDNVANLCLNWTLPIRRPCGSTMAGPLKQGCVVPRYSQDRSRCSAAHSSNVGQTTVARRSSKLYDGGKLPVAFAPRPQQLAIALQAARQRAAAQRAAAQRQPHGDIACGSGSVTF